MSKSLWGAPTTTEPTPFDEITPEMLEGVGGSKQTYPHEHRCPVCYISKPCNSACSIDPDQSDWQLERLVRPRGAITVCGDCSAEKQQTVEVPRTEPPARYEMRCGHCECSIHIGPEASVDEAFGDGMVQRSCWVCGESLEDATTRRLPARAGFVSTLRDITAAEMAKMGLRLRASQPEPPPTVSGELVTPPLPAALEGHPDLQALVAERDAFGRSKYGTGLRCHNGRGPLEDARQELGDLLQYLWQSLMEDRDISGQLDLMAQAITVLQQQRPPRAGGQMQTLTLQIFEPSKPFGGIFVAENAPEPFVAAIQDLLTLAIQRGQPSGEKVTVLEFVWNGEGVPGLLAGEMTDEDAIFLLSDVLEETAGIWADLDAKIACFASPGIVNNSRIRCIGYLTVRQCLQAAEVH